METLKLESDKVEKKQFLAEMETKCEKADMELKVDKLEFQMATDELQSLIDELLNKLLILVHMSQQFIGWFKY